MRLWDKLKLWAHCGEIHSWNEFSLSDINIRPDLKLNRVSLRSLFADGFKFNVNEGAPKVAKSICPSGLGAVFR